jgi:branched-chain amino acid transport system ATP-binding protein
MLRVNGVSMEFGGVRALSNVCFDVPAGQILAVIGPNGAGKTTLFNTISSLYRPTSGAILFQDTDLTRLEPHDLTALGIARTFQNPQTFQGATALQTVQIGRHSFSNRSLFQALFRPRGFREDEESLRQKSLELLRFVGLEEFAGHPADSMSYGAIKRLDLARAIAAEPKLLLLDEPAAGLNPSETEQLKELIFAIASRGTTIILVEHDMKLIMEISERIVVLNHGQVLTIGTPAEVRVNSDVLKAYLGAEFAETA